MKTANEYLTSIRNSPVAKLVFLIVIVLLAFASPKQSQAGMSSYKMTTSTGSALYGGNANILWQGFQGSRWYYGDYQWSGTIGLPFAFVFDGVTYYEMQVYSSGMITLGPNTNYESPNNELSNTPAPTIAAWWDDLFISGCQYCATAQISYEFYGSAKGGDECVIVDWSHIDGGYQSGYNELWINTQIRIYPDGKIELYYGTMGEGCGYTYSPNTSASMGLANGKSNFASVSVSSGKGGSTFSLSSASANNAVNLEQTPITPGSLLIFKQVPNVQLGVTPQPKTYNFGSLGTGQSATTAVTLTHVGTQGKLGINSVTLTGNPDFTLVSVPVSSDSLAVGTSRNIVVRFAPIIDGIRTASITIASTGLDSGIQTFTLTGIGLAPLISIDTNVLFKNKFVKLGDSLIARIIVSSNSNPTLVINALQIVGADAGEYYISRGLSKPAGIPGGTTDSFFVGYRPTKEGRRIATLNIVNNSINNPVLPVTLWGTGVLPHITITPNPMLFDSLQIGIDSCKKIRIHNPGTDTLLIKSNMLVSNDGDFTYSGLVGSDSIIPPDKFKEVTICFTPRAKGSRLARLRLTTNIPKTFEKPARDTASQFLIDIRGTGVPTGLISQTIGGIEGGGWMDSTLIGSTICIIDSLTNNGDADITISNIEITGADKADYALGQVSFPLVLKAKSTIGVPLCATPSHRGFSTATLTVFGTSSDKPIQSIALLNVKGLLTCLAPNPTALFMNTLIYKGSSETLCDTVTNCGDVAATYTATITGANAADYTVTPTTSATVAPGETAVFCVQYNPLAEGKSLATLSITAPNTPTQSVDLAGEAGCANLSVNIAGPDNVTKGGHFPFTITITNNGTFEWTPTGIEGLDSTVLNYISGLGPIAPGANIQVIVMLNPDKLGQLYEFPLQILGGPCPDSGVIATVNRTTDPTISVQDLTAQDGFILGQNHPNPFSTVTEFSYTTPAEAAVTLSLHDVTGKLVRTLSSGRVISGDHTVSFDASNLSSGTYLLMLESDGIRLLRQIVIAR